MRIEEVPQDLKYCKDAVVRDQNYAVDNDGRYHMVKSDGWTAKNDALDLALEEDEDKEERSRMTLQTADIFEGTELDISHQPAAHCENGAISTLLRYYGIELSEPMIFGLASGLFFTHLTFVKMGGMPVTSFRTFPGVLFKRITKLFGIKSRTQRFFSHKAAMKKLDELILHKQTPVGCVVGMYELPYMPKEYRFRFNGHNICITGKDESRKLYRVLDSNATQKVTISAEDLAKVRFPAGGVYPLMGQMYWIESLPKHLPDLKPLILKSIHKTWYSLPFSANQKLGYGHGQASCTAQSGAGSTYVGGNRNRWSRLPFHVWCIPPRSCRHNRHQRVERLLPPHYGYRRLVARFCLQGITHHQGTEHQEPSKLA